MRVIADRDTGSVLRLAWDKFSLVLAPGEDRVGETTLINDGLAQPATALLLGNSGSSESTSDAWLTALNPRLVLISVGAGNPEGNPSPRCWRGWLAGMCSGPTSMGRFRWRRMRNSCE